MRNNQPITNVEIPLNDDTLIVSKTDLKGRITYINRDFLQISGFTEQELLGEPVSYTHLTLPTNREV